MHLISINESGELTPAAVIFILETTAADGKSYQTREVKRIEGWNP